MKLQAASNSNAKKDYWDIAALLKEYSLDKMLKIFTAKFPQVDVGFIIHSLTDFEKQILSLILIHTLVLRGTKLKMN